MKSWTIIRKIAPFALTCALCLLLAGCVSSQDDQSAQDHQSEQEKAEGYYWYEAVFLDKEDVEAAFGSVAEDFPKFETVPQEFHVTTEFKPDPRHADLYGSPVTVHITGYTYGSVPDPEEGVVSDNEGFLVEISSPDDRMQQFLDDIDKKWHITGSYTIGGKYTEQLDFSDATPVDVTLTGVFGLGDSDGTITFE